ncbi:MAG: hypothetical protein ACLQOO_04525 [Terriglobia bacterium]
MSEIGLGPGGLLIVAGHAIWQAGRWHGGFPGEDPCYERHVRDSVALWFAERYHALAFSGSRSRPLLPEVRSGLVSNGEGTGMLSFARQAGLISAGSQEAFAEDFARDSFENVFYSLLAYRHRSGFWPSRVGVVSWKFKALRYYLIGLALGLVGRDFRFFGSGDPRSAEACEKLAVASVAYDAQIVDVDRMDIIDPLHRGRAFASKRVGRMPSEFGYDNGAYIEAVKRAYDAPYRETGIPGIVAEAISRVESLGPGPEWRTFSPPWLGSAI